MVAQEEELCRFGTLLFREDFGGNDPSDPAVGRTPVSGTHCRPVIPEQEWVPAATWSPNGDTAIPPLTPTRSGTSWTTTPILGILHAGTSWR